MLPLALFSTIAGWIWGHWSDNLSRGIRTFQVLAALVTLVIKIQNRGFSVSIYRTEKIVLNGAWLFCFFFGQAKKEEKNAATNRAMLNDQYSKLKE